MRSFLHEYHRGSLTLNVLGVLNVLYLLHVLNVLNVLNVLSMLMDASLACWALFIMDFECFFFAYMDLLRPPASW